MAARCSSTRSASSTSPCKRSCCACWRAGACAGWVRCARSRSTCASSPPPTDPCASSPRTGQVPRRSVLPPVDHRRRGAAAARPGGRHRASGRAFPPAACPHLCPTGASLTHRARLRLACASWPGNVRELRNTLEQVVVFHQGGEIDGHAFPFIVPDRPAAAQAGFALPPGGIDLEQLERSLTLQALERTGWNMTPAGRLLGLSRDAVRYRVEKFQLRADPGDVAREQARMYLLG